MIGLFSEDAESQRLAAPSTFNPAVQDPDQSNSAVFKGEQTLVEEPNRSKSINKGITRYN